MVEHALRQRRLDVSLLPPNPLISRLFIYLPSPSCSVPRHSLSVSRSQLAHHLLYMGHDPLRSARRPSTILFIVLASLLVSYSRPASLSASPFLYLYTHPIPFSFGFPSSNVHSLYGLSWDFCIYNFVCFLRWLSGLFRSVHAFSYTLSGVFWYTTEYLILTAASFECSSLNRYRISFLPST
jgi:hypothetical protein